MGLAATLPTELIETICKFASEFDFEDYDRVVVGRVPVLNQPVAASALASIPLIHPRWAFAGQTALYRRVVLTSARQYKQFQESLMAFPYNAVHVRGLRIEWGRRDFGGYEGYAYHVLGWFYEMEIQHLVRLCPCLEAFSASETCLPISREGIDALSMVNGMRYMTWRSEEVWKYTAAILRAHSGWKHLEALTLRSIVLELAIALLAPVTNLKTVRLHQMEHWTAAGWVASLERAAGSSTDFRLTGKRATGLPINHLVALLHEIGANLTTLHLTAITPPFPDEENRNLPIQSLPVIFTLAPCLQELQFKTDNDEALPDETSESPYKWRSESLVWFQLDIPIRLHASVYYRIKQTAFPRFKAPLIFRSLEKYDDSDVLVL